MEAAHHALGRSRQAVLDEPARVDAGGAHDVGVEGPENSPRSSTCGVGVKSRTPCSSLWLHSIAPPGPRGVP